MHTTQAGVAPRWPQSLAHDDLTRQKIIIIIVKIKKGVAAAPRSRSQQDDARSTLQTRTTKCCCVAASNLETIVGCPHSFLELYPYLRAMIPFPGPTILLLARSTHAPDGSSSLLSTALKTSHRATMECFFTPVPRHHNANRPIATLPFDLRQPPTTTTTTVTVHHKNANTHLPAFPVSSRAPRRVH